MYMDCLHGKWPLDAIKAVFSRRYLLQNCAIEVFTSTGCKYLPLRPLYVHKDLNNSLLISSPSFCLIELKLCLDIVSRRDWL